MRKVIQSYKPLYTVKEVAVIFGTNTNYIYDLIKQGKLPSLKINNAKRIRGSDLERYIESIPTEDNS